MLKVSVLVSGGGTNLQAIIDRVADGKITNTEIVKVISNKKGAWPVETSRLPDHAPFVCAAAAFCGSRACSCAPG